MDFSGIGTSLGIALGDNLPRILGAIAILIIGWIVAVAVRGGVRRLLDLTLASGPFEVLVKEIAAYLPRVVAGTLLILVAWLAAVALRAIVNRVLDAWALPTTS